MGFLSLLLAASSLVALAGPAVADGAVRVYLLDVTAFTVPGAGVGPGGGMIGAPGNGFGMMGQGFGRGYGMMGGGMGPMSIRTNAATVKAGTITFDVSNLSRSLTHEMLVVAVDSPSVPLPYDYSTGRVPEEQVTSPGESGELAPNAETTVTLELKPGSYLLLCNVPGHYAAGMWTTLTVAE